MKNFFSYRTIVAIAMLLIAGNIAYAQNVVYNTVTNQKVSENNGQSVTYASSLTGGIIPNRIVVGVDNGWDNDFLSSVGATGSDFYVQPFIANLSAITKFGVVIQQSSGNGQVLLSIFDDVDGKPNWAAPLYEGTLKTPTATAAWYFESGINVPLVIGKKYYVVVDGYNNAGATGNCRIGTSNTAPMDNGFVKWTNDAETTNPGWVNWGLTYKLAIYVEGTPPPVPVSKWSVIMAFAVLGGVTFVGLRRKVNKNRI